MTCPNLVTLVTQREGKLCPSGGICPRLCQGQAGHGQFQGGHGHLEGVPGPAWPWAGSGWPQPMLAMAKSKVIMVQSGQGQGGHGSEWPRCSWPGQRWSQIHQTQVCGYWSWPSQGGHGSTKLMLVDVGHSPAQGGHGPGPPKSHQRLLPTSQAPSMLLNSRNSIKTPTQFCFKDDKLPLFLEKERTPRFYSWKKPQPPVSMGAGHCDIGA